MANWATERLDELVRGIDVVLPPVTKTLRLGTIDSWAPGSIKKTWQPHPELLNVDGSLFGGYIAALADQALTLAAMTRVPDDFVFRTLNLSVNFLRVAALTHSPCEEWSDAGPDLALFLRPADRPPRQHEVAECLDPFVGRRGRRHRSSRYMRPSASSPTTACTV
jgi:hypothetical protein